MKTHGNGILIALLALVKFTIQMLGNRNYGFHRDELLHLSVSEHLDWGFMEFPPFIGVLGKFSYLFFDYSLMGTRLFPTLAGVAILIICCLMAKELKGGRFAILLAGIAVLSFLPFYRNHTLFQPVAFDQLFWTLGFYYILRFINMKQRKYLLLTGLVLGFGLLNKYTILIWAFGVFVGMIFYNRASVFKNKWWYLSGLLALLLVLPNIIWQVENDFPLWRHLQELSESQLNEIGPFDFGLEQLSFPFTLILSVFGVFLLFRSQPFRSLGIAAILIFVTMWALQAKPYYVFAVYPILFAAGAVQVEILLHQKKTILKYVVVVLLLMGAVPFIPDLTPILPIEMFTDYAKIEPNDEGRYELTGDYADMFGWEEQVKLVDSVYRTLPESERKNCVFWAENYGEAGALKILGKKYGLPNPISRHGSFWTWGPGNVNATTWISLGNEPPAVKHIFEETQLIKTIYHPYAIDEENGIPVYLCRKPKQDINAWWKAYEPYIFD
ncbi:MAG: glycosyltransferase family 39 protein [Bacteroidota bacterium]